MDFYGFWWWQSRFNRDRWFANSVNTLIHVSTVDHPLFEIVFQLAPGQIRFPRTWKFFSSWKRSLIELIGANSIFPEIEF